LGPLGQIRGAAGAHPALARAMRPLLLGLALLAWLVDVPGARAAAPINLATVSCQKYQNEILPSAGSDQKLDPINTVMWLFGFSVAKTGARVMYGDALTSFGFALDAECKNNPNEPLQDALSAVKHVQKNPMDLQTLDCGIFLERHLDLAKSDRESADTIMMWLFGFSVQKQGGHLLESDKLTSFETKFLAECGKRRERSLYDTLVSLKP
jgi:hypothetical protein